MVMDTLKIKKTELAKQRIELQISEFEIRKLDLQVELENLDNQIVRARQQIQEKVKEIEDLRTQ